MPGKIFRKNSDSPPYQITTNKQEAVIKLNRSLIEQEKLEQFLDYLSIKAMQKTGYLQNLQTG